MPPMSNTAPTMTGDSAIALLTGQEEPLHGLYIVCVQVYEQASVWFFRIVTTPVLTSVFDGKVVLRHNDKQVKP